MNVLKADSAGFCAGVERAVGEAASLASRGRVCCLGEIVHNKAVTADLAALGARVIHSLDEAEPGETVLLRAHGEPPETYEAAARLGLKLSDCTCPHVRLVQRLAHEAREAGRLVIIAGKREHPEVRGVNGYTGYTAVITDSAGALACPPNAPCTLVAQTTFEQAAYDAIARRLRELSDDVIVHGTICPATRRRQDEAAGLAAKCGAMVIVGDKHSANAQNLFAICRTIQPKSYFIETFYEIHDLPLQILKSCDTIGLTAGASTPSATIKEAYKRMNELENLNPAPEDEGQPAAPPSAEQSFEDLLNGSVVALHTGDIVTGTVISVVNGEVLVNLGYKSDGLIPKGQFSNDPDADVEQLAKRGEQIEVFVVRVNDGDGNVLLSKKKVSERKAMEELERAAEDGTPLPGKIVEVVKGGCMALINGVRAFVPSSQASDRFVKDLNDLKGKEFNFQIIQFEKGKRQRVVAGRKELAAKEAAEKREKALAALEVGSRVNGVVSRIAEFGAFIDLGGVDGLVHISRLAWGRVRKVSDVLKEGQEVTVYVNEVNKEKGKVSLSLKDVTTDPWLTADVRYPVGDIIEGAVVRLVPFGAFIELEDGVDGLVHISQIADRRINRPEDVLTIGDKIYARILGVDMQARRISLSIRAVDEVYDDEGEYDEGEYDESYDDEAYDDAEPAEAYDAAEE